MTGEISYFQDILRTARSGNNVKMNLLKKTLSGSEEKKRKVLDVEVDGDVSELFRENLKGRCQSILNNDKLVCKCFFTESTDEYAILVINEEEMNSVTTLIPVITKIKGDDESELNPDSKEDKKSRKGKIEKKKKEPKTVTKFTEGTLSDLVAYTISMSSIYSDNGNDIKETCIYFRQYQKGSKIARAKLGFITMGWKNGIFSKVEGDVFKCDDITDAIYYERRYLNDLSKASFKIMFVENKSAFEEIFSFDEFYRKSAEKVYETLCLYPNVKLDREFYDKYINGKKHLRRVCAFDKEGIFRNIDFNDMFQVIETTSNEGYLLNLVTEDKNIIIKDDKSFEAFVYLCKYHVMKSLPKGTICFVDKSTVLQKKEEITSH